MFLKLACCVQNLRTLVRTEHHLRKVLLICKDGTARQTSHVVYRYLTAQ